MMAPDSADDAAANADGLCQHLHRAISILLMDRTIPNRAMINKAQCICYYCNPVSRLLFVRGGRKDILCNDCVKIAFNFTLKDDSESALQVTNTYRRLYYGAPSNTIAKSLLTKRFFPRGTRFVPDDSGNLVEEPSDANLQAPFDRLNYATGLLEKFNPNQVFVTPEPELAFHHGEHPNGKISVQILFDQKYVFTKGQCSILPGSEGIIRKGSLNKDVRTAEEQAAKFRERVSFTGTPDSETDYYLNAEGLFDQQAMCPNFYFFALYFRFDTAGH